MASHQFLLDLSKIEDGAYILGLGEAALYGGLDEKNAMPVLSFPAQQKLAPTPANTAPQHRFRLG